MKYCGSLSSQVILKLPCGSRWEVGLTKSDGNVWIENGWNKFAEHCSLGLAEAMDERLIYFFFFFSFFAVKQRTLREENSDKKAWLPQGNICQLQRKGKRQGARPEPHQLLYIYILLEILYGKKKMSFLNVVTSMPLFYLSITLPQTHLFLFENPITTTPPLMYTYFLN